MMHANDQRDILIALAAGAVLFLVFIVSLVCLIRNKKRNKSIKVPLVSLIVSIVLCGWSISLALFIYTLSNTLFLSM